MKYRIPFVRIIVMAVPSIACMNWNVRSNMAVESGCCPIQTRGSPSPNSETDDDSHVDPNVTAQLRLSYGMLYILTHTPIAFILIQVFSRVHPYSRRSNTAKRILFFSLKVKGLSFVCVCVCVAPTSRSLLSSFVRRSLDLFVICKMNRIFISFHFIPFQFHFIFIHHRDKVPMPPPWRFDNTRSPIADTVHTPDPIPLTRVRHGHTEIASTRRLVAVRHSPWQLSAAHSGPLSIQNPPDRLRHRIHPRSNNATRPISNSRHRDYSWEQSMLPVSLYFAQTRIRVPEIAIDGRRRERRTCGFVATTRGGRVWNRRPSTRSCRWWFRGVDMRHNISCDRHSSNPILGILFDNTRRPDMHCISNMASRASHSENNSMGDSWMKFGHPRTPIREFGATRRRSVMLLLLLMLSWTKERREERKCWWSSDEWIGWTSALIILLLLICFVPFVSLFEFLWSMKRRATVCRWYDRSDVIDDETPRNATKRWSLVLTTTSFLSFFLSSFFHSFIRLHACMHRNAWICKIIKVQRRQSHQYNSSTKPASKHGLCRRHDVTVPYFFDAFDAQWCIGIHSHEHESYSSNANDASLVYIIYDH